MGECWNSSSPETSFQIKPDYITKSKAQREEALGFNLKRVHVEYTRCIVKVRNHLRLLMICMSMLVIVWTNRG